MAEIRKYSLVYDSAEDRIAWDLEDLEGATTRLWLTQRFCRALVAAVLPMLTRPATKDAAGAEPPPEHETTLQAWRQAAALSDFGKTSGVKATEDTSTGLVTQVQLAPNPDGLTFTFEFGQSQQRVLGASAAAVRQTLAVMHRLHVQAGWPLDFWPDWVADPVAVAGVADTGLAN